MTVSPSRSFNAVPTSCWQRASLRMSPCRAKALRFLAWLAWAADEEAVLVFNLPLAPLAQGESPLCNELLDLSRMLADTKLRAALIGGDPAAVQVLGSISAIRNQVQRFGGNAGSLLVRHAAGSVSQCQSGCLILPKGAWVKEIRSSDREGARPRLGGVAACPRSFPRCPKNPRGVTASAPLGAWRPSVLPISPATVHQLSRDNRTFCTTAVNLSRVAPAKQVVRVIFER